MIERTPRDRRVFLTKCLAGAAVALPRDVSGDAAIQTAAPSPPAPPRSAPPAEQQLRTMLAGMALTQMLYVVARYGIAERLESGARTAKDLAQAAGLHEGALYRVLRCLASQGVFREEPDRRFSQNAVSALLVPTAAGSLHAQAVVRGEDFFWKAWGALRESVRTGQTGFEVAYGENTFDWFAKNPDAARLFDAGQAAATTAAGAAIAEAYPFGEARLIVDVGGGNGALLRALLSRHPAPAGLLFDLPHVVDAARAALAESLGARVRLTGGSFFDAVPAGGDLYVLKYILHDWEETRALAILANLKRTMAPAARLLVIEDLICAPNVPCAAKLIDVTMLARTGGRNMTDDEYRDLLGRGGFKPLRTIRVQGDLALIEAAPG